MAKKKGHQDEMGRPTNNRGKPPHKGGYHGAMKGVRPNKSWFEVTSGFAGGYPIHHLTVAGPWNCGTKHINS